MRKYLVDLIKRVTNFIYAKTVVAVGYETKLAHKEINAITDKVVKYRLAIKKLEARKKQLIDDYGEPNEQE